MAGKSDSKKRKGAKRPDRSPHRTKKATHGMVRRQRANKKPGGRRQAQREAQDLLKGWEPK